MKKLFIIMFLFLLCGCSNKNVQGDKVSANNKDKPQIENSDEIIELKDFPNIKKNSDNFYNFIISSNANIILNFQEFSLSQYADAKYYIVNYLTNSKDQLTLKFNSDGQLLGATLLSNSLESISKDFINTRILMPNYSYFSFSASEIDNISNLIYGMSDEAIEINDWKVTGTIDSKKSFHIFSIMQIKE